MVLKFSNTKIVRDVFGSTINPVTKALEPICRWTFKNTKGMSMQIINYGATLTSVKAPDRCGCFEDVCLGFDTIEGYKTVSNPYIGATIGRVCSRISNGRFRMLSKNYELSKNFLGKHQLHGGILGFDKVHWELDEELADTVTLKHVSPAGSEGFPGEVTAKASYTLDNDNTITIVYEAKGTETTPINMANHAYFNLGGHDAGRAALMDHTIMIKAEKYVEKDEETIPTGRIFHVAGTPYDMRKFRSIGKGIELLEEMNNIGYDDNFCLKPKRGQVLLTSKVYHSKSGRLMVIMSNQPAVHFYTANVMPDIDKGDTPIFGKNNAQYGKQCAFMVSPNQYPDAVNRPEFPPSYLCPGKKYRNIMKFVFLAVDHDD